MPDPLTIDVLVLVKAAPVMTSALEETMCVAGVRTDGGRRDWVRLHPVPFRDLADDEAFSKYQSVGVSVIRPRSDRRPETWTPIHGSIRPGGTIGPQYGWAARRPFVEALGEQTMCELIQQNRAGSGPGVPSLGVVRPVEPPTLEITQRDEEQLSTWRSRAAAAVSSPSLFDDPTEQKVPFEVVPWRFRYCYRCAAPGCRGHEQTIVDWEVVSLWRNVRRRSGWRDAMRHKFERQMWTNRDTVLFVGNMEQHPWNFLVLGVFWPPAGDVQGAFDL
jgi:hypothetical protein